MSEDEDIAVEALLDFLNAVEAGIARAKQLIGDKKRVTAHPNYDELTWTEQQGAKGPYEQACRKNGNADVFDRLRAELKAHSGFWQYNGWKYWFHAKNEDLIDRRRS